MIAKAAFSLFKFPIHKKATITKTSTNTNAKKLCKKVIVNILLPSFFKLVNLNSPPIEKAINPNAKSTMIDNDLTSKIYVPDLL